MKTEKAKVRVGFSAPLWIWAALLSASAQSLAWGQSQAEAFTDVFQNQVTVPSEDTKGPSPPQSKKESERIYGIVPAYSISDARGSPPLKSREKFNLFVRGTLDPFPFGLYAVQAGVSQASDTHSGYGQGAEGYAKRFGAALGDGTSARFFSTFVFPSILHQDPRYFRKGEGSGRSRVRYSISRGFLTRGDSGQTQPNWSNIFGKFAGAGLSNVYYPQEDRGATLTLTRVALSLSYQMIGNLAIEFWPEIHRKFLGGNKGQRSPSSNP